VPPIHDHPRRGAWQIKPGDTLIEATSGNHRYRAGDGGGHAWLQDGAADAGELSEERRQSMAAYGARIVLTPKSGGMEYARDLAEQMQKNGEGLILDQFANPDNPLATTRPPVPKSGAIPRAASPTSSVPWARPEPSWVCQNI
jgi:hypothetical protein